MVWGGYRARTDLEDTRITATKLGVRLSVGEAREERESLGEPLLR